MGAGTVTPAIFFDGQTAKEHRVVVNFDHTRLQITGDDIPETVTWQYSDVREQLDQAGPQAIIVSSTGDPARLIIEDQASADWVRSVAHDLTNPDTPKGSYRRLGVFATMAIGSVCLILFVIIPALSNTLAMMLPVEREVALGKGTVRQIERVLTIGRDSDLTCSSVDGDAALAKMAARFAAHIDNPYPLSVRVFDHDMVNAFAAPGGHVILFKGLIEAADSPEEVAGVLGHELGHVIHRDPTRLALRSAGSVGILGMLLGDFSGGAATVFLADQLIAADYAQDAETNADLFATQLFADAKLPSTSFANFFDTLAKEYGRDEEGLISHLASHPQLRRRADAARAADTIGGKDFVPVLTPAEWKSLRAICDK